MSHPDLTTYAHIDHAFANPSSFGYMQTAQAGIATRASGGEHATESAMVRPMSNHPQSMHYNLSQGGHPVSFYHDHTMHSTFDKFTWEQPYTDSSIETGDTASITPFDAVGMSPNVTDPLEHDTPNDYLYPPRTSFDIASLSRSANTSARRLSASPQRRSRHSVSRHSSARISESPTPSGTSATLAAGSSTTTSPNLQPQAEPKKFYFVSHDDKHTASRIRNREISRSYRASKVARIAELERKVESMKASMQALEHERDEWKRRALSR